MSPFKQLTAGLIRATDRKTEGEKGRQTDREAEEQTGRQTERQTARRQAETETVNCREGE